MGANQGALVAGPQAPPPAIELNAISELHSRFKEMEADFRLWLSKQPLPVEATVVTATSAAPGAAPGASWGRSPPTPCPLPLTPLLGSVPRQWPPSNKPRSVSVLENCSFSNFLHLC